MTVQDFQLRVANKNPCRVATTANITTLAGGAPDTVDGISLAAGDRVLVKDQSAGETNGIYVIDTLGTGSNGVWSRALDMDDVSDDAIRAGLNTYIQEGTVNEKRTFYLTTTGTITLGSTPLTFEVGPTAGAGSIAGSTGATDNAILRADGTGGGTVQASGVTIDDSDNLGGSASVGLAEQASAPVTPGAGNGVLWAKQVGGLTPSNVPYYTDENALDVAIVRSVDLTRSMPSSSGTSVELGTFAKSNGQSFGLFVHTGTATSNVYAAYYRVVVQNPVGTGGFVTLQPLYTGGPLNQAVFGDLLQVEMSVAVGGAISLRARSYLGLVQDVFFRLVLDGDDTGRFTPSSTQATTTATTTNYSNTMLTMTDAVNAALGGSGIVAWKPFYLEERAAADTDVAGFGQLWVRNDSPNVLVFTNDAGTDTVLGQGSPVTQTNVVYVSKAGNNSNSGLTLNSPKLTVASAITAASGLTPSTTNRIDICVMDGGIYAETVALPDYVSLIGPGATIDGQITPGIESTIRLRRSIRSSGTAVICIQVLDAGPCYLHIDEIINPSANGFAAGIKVDSASSIAHLNVGKMEIDGGVAIWNDDAGTITGSVGEIEITGTGWGLYLDSAGPTALKIDRITESGTATFGVQLLGGALAYLYVGEFTTSNTYQAATGTTLNLFVGRLTGTPGTVTGTVNVTQAGVSGGISGTTGATDNALLRADGTGGSTAQASQVTIGDTGLVSNAIGFGMSEQATAPSSPGAGNGLFWVKNDAPSTPMFTDDTSVSDRVLVGKAAKPASNVTLADNVTWVSVVSVTLEANTFYAFTLNLLYQVTAADDIEFRFTRTSTAAVIASSDASTTTYLHSNVIQLNTTGALEMASLTGSMVGGGSGGTITVEARKQTDTGGDGTVDEETNLVLTRIE